MNLAARVTVVLVTVPVILVSLLYENRLVVMGISISLFEIFLLVVTVWGTYELSAMMIRLDPKVRKLFLLVGSLTVFFGGMLFNSFEDIPARLYYSGLSSVTLLTALLLFFSSLTESIVSQDISGSVTRAAIYPATLFLVPFLLAVYLPFGHSGSGRRFVLSVMIISWVTDSAAFFTGFAVGRRKILPRVSPGKTWEGTLGGVAGGSLTGGILAAVGFLGGGAVCGAIWGLVLSITGQLGDLVESVLKREAGLKDSGTILPGHGGILDALDSTIFNAFPVYIYVILNGVLP